MKIRTKIYLSFLTDFILVAALIGLVVGLFSTNLIEKNISSHLQSSNESRARHIRTFIEDQQKTSVILAAASVYRDFLKEPKNSSKYPVIKEKIDNRLARTLEADPQIYESFILNSKGIIVASSDPTKEGLDRSQDAYFTEAKNKVFFKDVYFSDVVNKVTYSISSPIIDDGGMFLGVSVLRYLPNTLFSIVQEDVGLGKTEESFLINKDKFFITPSKTLGDSVILKQKVETKNSENCFNKEEMRYVEKNSYSGLVAALGSQVTEAKDYRGVEVMATHSYIPETGWCLITKADRQDLLYFRYPLSYFNASILLFCLVIFILMGMYISRRISDPISKLIIGAKQIEQGDLEYRVGLDSDDEIGTLSRSFDKMVESMKKAQSEIQIKVEDQTNIISQKAHELEDQKSAILNILEDVEGEKNRTEKLAEDLEKFKLAVDNSSDHIIITDPEGIIVYANKAMEKITGYNLEESIGKKAGVLWKFPMPTEYYKILWRTIKEEKVPFISQLKNKRKGGEEYDAEIKISPILDDKGNVVFFVGVERDITHEKQVDRAKTEFVSLASHQLRTPLSAINWYTEMLLDGDAGKLNKEQKKYTTEIYLASQRMVELVNSFLNVSRMELGTLIIEPEDVEIDKIAESVLGELQPQVSEKKLILTEAIAKDLPKLKADPKLVRMILQNLLSNSVKYTPTQGNIDLEIGIIKKGRLIGGVKAGEDSVYFKVVDTGYGIPVAQRDKIFTKLFRADNVRQLVIEGTGLGLYIVKSIVEEAKGKVWFVSPFVEKITPAKKPAKRSGLPGTAFYVLLPVKGMASKQGTKKLA